LLNAGYDIKNVKRIILTHVHVDHAQAAKQIKEKSGAKIYSHWIEANYLAHKPSYNGPPTTQETIDKLKKLGISIEELTKKYGSFDVEPIIVDKPVSDGDMIGSLRVIHTPGIRQDIFHFIIKKTELFLELIVYINTYLVQMVCMYLLHKYQ
jgi:glyoxylase-like metal-dependent hydrolase (beta-lactamase superfamily II)